jgi:hypothetical protein
MHSISFFSQFVFDEFIAKWGEYGHNVDRTLCVSRGLTSKPAVTVSSGLASKPAATVSPSLASKPVVGFLVEPQNQGGGGFPDLGLKTDS